MLQFDVTVAQSFYINLKHIRMEEWMQMDKNMVFTIQEQRTITLLIGHMEGSDQAVYVYIDYSPSTFEKLVEENPNWLYEEIAGYQKIHTIGGAIILRKGKLGRFKFSES